MQINVRLITKNDNPLLAKIIRQVMEEFGVNLPNTVYTDPTTDDLYELFQKDKAIKLAAEGRLRAVIVHMKTGAAFLRPEFGSKPFEELS